MSAWVTFCNLRKTLLLNLTSWQYLFKDLSLFRPKNSQKISLWSLYSVHPPFPCSELYPKNMDDTSELQIHQKAQL